MLELQRNKHVLPPATSHNVIKWKREMETMTLNNYLGKIFFLYLSQCELCLHCVVSLWAIDTGGLPFASHADFRWSQSRRACAKATRAVGEEVKFSTEFDSAVSCESPLTTLWNSKLSEKRFTSTKNRRGKKRQLDRMSSLKITADGNQSWSTWSEQRPWASIQRVFFHC